MTQEPAWLKVTTSPVMAHAEFVVALPIANVTGLPEFPPVALSVYVPEIEGFVGAVDMNATTCVVGSGVTGLSVAGAGPPGAAAVFALTLRSYGVPFVSPQRVSVVAADRKVWPIGLPPAAGVATSV